MTANISEFRQVFITGGQRRSIRKTAVSSAIRWLLPRIFTTLKSLTLPKRDIQTRTAMGCTSGSNIFMTIRAATEMTCPSETILQFLIPTCICLTQIHKIRKTPYVFWNIFLTPITEIFPRSFWRMKYIRPLNPPKTAMLLGGAGLLTSSAR